LDPRYLTHSLLLALTGYRRSKSLCDAGKISVGCAPRRDGTLEIIKAAKLYFSD